MYQNILEQLGLTKNESLVYQALLKLGRSPIIPILKETKLKRGNAYKILYTLIDKKLITQFKKDKKTYFQIEPPINLQNLIELKEKSLEQIKKSLANILPSLESDYRLVIEKPIVRYFEGIAGLKKIYQDTLKEKKPIYAFLSIEDVHPKLKSWLDKFYIKKRAELNIPAQVIISSKVTGVKTKEYLELDKKYKRKTLIIPEKKSPFEIEINIYGNKTAFISYKKEIIGIIVESPAISKTIKAIFNLIWQKYSSL